MSRLFKFFIPIALLCLCSSASAQLLITEIMYNPPESGVDSLEYIEIYNAGSDAVDVTGYRIEGVNYDFPDGMMAAGEFKLIAVNPTVFENTFGIAAEPFSGGLSNGGEDVSIRDASDLIVHEVVYDNISPWPTDDDGADGEGASIVICDLDNPSIPESWKASQEATGVLINDREVKGSPGSIDDTGCNGGPSGIVVATDGLNFVPADITINVGETITFYNTGGNHNANGSLATYPDNPAGFYSGDPSTDEWEFPFTFNIAGVYNYQCDLHVGAGMVGTVTVLALPDNSDLRVTEVFYNSGIMLDSLEYIEVYNAGSSTAQLENYTIVTAAINATLGEGMVAPGEYMVICRDLSAFSTVFGTTINAIEWGDGTLSNNGDNILISNADGMPIIDVTYDDEDMWPGEADGFGASLIVCDPIAGFSLENVKANTYPEIDFDGKQFQVSPGEPNYCTFSIEDVTTNDAQGINLKNGVNAIIEGIVYGINFNSQGLQFTLIDDQGNGIGVYSENEDFGYTVTEGNVLRLRGSIGQFSGLSQITLEGITLEDELDIEMPTIVTELNESTESQFVRIENVSLVDPTQWNNSLGGFNVDVTDGTNTFAVRIDNDTDMIPLNYPTGTFTVTGLGGQFDQSAPFDEGYQIFPRTMADIDPFNPFVNFYPPSSIEDVTANNSEGVALSLGDQVTLEGTVYGFNLRTPGLQFTIIDDAGDGIAVFTANEDFGYTVNEGDKLEIKGSIDQFNGLTEIIPDSLKLIGAGTLESPIFIISNMAEFSESQYIEISNDVTLVDATQWLGDGSTFSVDVTDGTNTFEVLIDNDTDLANTPLPAHDVIHISGIGSQRDISSPFNSGYRIIPRYADDISFIVSNNETELEASISLYPNPATSYLKLEYDGTIQSYELYDIVGARKLIGASTTIDVSHLTSGNYMVKVFTDEGVAIKQVLLIK